MPVDAMAVWSARFGNLFATSGTVKNGFVPPVDLAEIKSRDNFNARELSENLMFGTPEEVRAKLKGYEALGVDTFLYFTSFGLDRATDDSLVRQPSRARAHQVGVVDRFVHARHSGAGRATKGAVVNGSKKSSSSGPVVTAASAAGAMSSVTAFSSSRHCKLILAG